MKTWTNPTVEELEVEMTAGGIPMSLLESGYLPGIWGDNNTPPVTPPVTPPETPDPEVPGVGTEEPGKDDTPDGMS